jgi:hypothetical protein
MNAPARHEALREADHVPGLRRNPGGDTVPRELCPDERIPPGDTPGPHAPDAGAVETFAGGAGI